MCHVIHSEKVLCMCMSGGKQQQVKIQVCRHVYAEGWERSAAISSRRQWREAAECGWGDLIFERQRKDECWQEVW